MAKKTDGEKSNLEKYKSDLKELINIGERLWASIQYKCFPEKLEGILKKVYKDKQKEALDELKSFSSFGTGYQSWYSESFVLLKQLLPDRLDDFNSYYKKDSKRKEITNSNYVIEDYLQGTEIISCSGETVVGPSAAIPKFTQQLNIVKSIEKIFESSLFDIKQLLQSDLFDNELDSAKELLKKGFLRGAGAIAGVVLEEHFSNICKNHNIKTRKTSPGINDFNALLKENKIIEIDIFRFIQRLGDLRNKCDHKKTVDPTKQDITELINGVDRIIKTVF